MIYGKFVDDLVADDSIKDESGQTGMSVLHNE
jgi:hypothetical protein